MTFDFTDKVVLITGGGAGLGLGCAEAFAKAGASVVITDISQDSLDSAIEAISKTGGKISGYINNVTDSSQVKELVENIVKDHGRLDIAVNNAGTSSPLTEFADIEESEYERVMDVNVKGVWLCMQAEIRQMLKQGGGTIVNVASALSKNTFPNATPYVTSKFAVAGLTRNVAIEYVDRNIRINGICPGNVETPLVRRMVEDYSTLYAKHAMKRLGTTDEVANGVMFLASDLSTFSTGTLLEVDGGWTAI